jgi:hypothetical protein
MADLDVTVGVDTAAAEEGMRRLSTLFHREIAAIDRSKAEAQIGVNATELKKQVLKAKRELLTLQEVEANPEVELDEKEFKAEVARLKMELKRLGLYKTEIQINSQQIKDANRLTELHIKRQEAMAKQSIKLRKEEERLRREKQRMIATAYRENDAFDKQRVEIHKLREAYSKLGAEERRLEKTGRPNGILRSPEEVRRLERVRAEMGLLRSRIVSLDGSVADINPEMEHHGNILGRWASSLSDVRLHMGFFSANLKQVAAGLVILGPLLTGVLGGLTSLVGVLGTSLAGALAVSSAGLAGLALSAGGVAGIIVPIVGELKEATAASEAYHKAVIKYGKGSDEAVAAQEKLSQTLKGISPSARRTIGDIGKLKDRWRELTAAAREPVFEGAAQGIKTVEALMPTFAKQTVATTRVFASSWTEAMRALRSDSAKSGLGAVMSNFRRGLPSLLDGFGELASMFGRITVSASKFIPGLNNGFAAWARDLNHAVGYGSDLDSTIGRLVNHMQEFGHFMQASGRLLVSVLNLSADSGAGLLKTMTRLFNGWSDWMATVEGRNSMREFFAEAADETREFGALLGNLVEFFFQMSRIMAPLSDTTIRFLTAAGDIITAAQSIPGINVALQKTAELMALIFIVNRVKAFAGAARGAAAAMGLMTAASAGAAVGPTGTPTPVPVGGGKGKLGGLVQKAGRWILPAALTISAIEIGDEVRSSFQGDSLGDKIMRGLTYGPDELARDYIDKLTDAFEDEKVEPTLRMSPKLKARGATLPGLEHGLGNLRSGAIASLGDITKVVRQNAQIIANELPRGSREARVKTAENFRAAAEAIKKGMQNGTIAVEKGTARMRELMRNARLVEGRDPLGLAKGFADSWREAGGISKRNREKIIDELRKMPGAARREAYQMMVAYGRGLVRGKKIPEEDLRLFKSGALTELQNIGGGFSGLSGTVYEALSAIGGNLRQALEDMGVDAPKFTLSRKQIMNNLTPLAPIQNGKGGRQGHQQGGFTVSGYGSGDHVNHTLPNGSFVMNREASTHFGLNRGGAVQTILEPKERVFMPHEVKRYGAGNLAAMNDAVPRQKGGPIGKLGPEPKIAGPSGMPLEIGHQAVKQAYAAAQKFYDKQSAKFGGIGAALPPGAPANLAAAMQLATAMGLSITSTTGGRHAPGSYHYQGRAFDASNGVGTPEQRAFAIATARRWGSNVLEMFYDPLGWYIKNGQKVSGAIGDHSDHVHVAMLKGGLVQMLAKGGIVAERFAQSTAANSAPYNAAMALFEAGVVETGDPTLSSVPSGGDGSSRGALQLLATTAAGLGVNPMNTRAVADLFYERGFTGKGGAISLAQRGMRPGDIAQAVQGSAYPERYAQQAGVARSLIEGAGLHYNGQQFKGYGTAEGGGAGGRQGLPNSVKADVRSYRTTPDGGLIGTERKDVPVPLTVPDFGPLPEKEGEVRKELIELERRTMPEYRSALRQHKDKKAIAAKLRECLAKIEQRIRDLRGKLRELRYAKAKKRVSKKLGKQLGRITGFEPRIEAARTAYEEKDQYAAQVVGQEPEQPGELTSDWITKTLDPYVTQQETPAYAAVLDAENTWRNMILGAEEAAGGITKGWETTIGYPQAKRKPFLENPDLHWPPGAEPPTGLAQWIYSLHDQIDRIREFANSKTPKWWSEHPAARKQRDVELGTIDTWLAPQLGLARHRRKGTIGALAEGRNSFDWFRGTGTFEESLRDVQGLHRYPEQHEKLASLPGLPVPGVFGGAIWDTQETISDLGLKVKQAKESLESSSGGEDKAAEISGFEEAIRGLLAGRPFLQDTHRGPFMGAFAQGGVALVGERGPELAHMPHGTRIHDAEDTARLLEPKVVVDLSRLNYGPFAGQGLPGGGSTSKVYNVTNRFDAPPPDPHTWTRQQDFELRTLS